MKKSTIWLIAFVMGASFLALLYMQTRYLAEVIEIRKEQFDESVRHSLYLVARNLELRETRAGLEAELKTQGHAAGEALGKAQSAPAAMHQGADDLPLPADSNVTVPQKFFFAKRRRLPVDEAFRDSVRQRYIYQRGLLDEVVYDILYQTNEKPLAERIDFSLMDHDLRTSLKRNGIDIDYHFYVTTSDGREIYRCSDYTAEGEDFTYKQVLYPNDTQAQMGLLYIHFPEMQKYIFSSVRFIIPAIVFTLVLLIAFIFTIYTIFRQKRLTEIKNDFINNMTHEFKTPISTISLAAQMLGDGSVTKSESMLKHLSGIIVDETKRLRFQVEKVLQMSMFEKKADTFKRKELDANRVIQDIVTTFRLKVETAGGTIDAHVEAAKDMVFVDEMHFTNVVFNLMDNAIKYKHPDRPLQLRVSTESTDSRYIIRVADNGIGIKKEDLKKIFEKFYRVHTGNRHDVKGFGLGLAYVKNVVTALGGNIHAESEYGRGTTFIISLPLLK